MDLNSNNSLRNLNFNQAIQSYPFEGIVKKYARFEHPLNSEHLTELVMDLTESKYLKQLEAQLSEKPALSALYRYDPFTMSSKETWAGSIPRGPTKAWLRMFKGLSFDDIVVTQSSTEALIMINKPSVLVRGINSAREVSEPTVLFSSDILRLSALQSVEQENFGVSFKHGDMTHEVLPGGDIRNSSILIGYYDYESSQNKK